MSNNPYANPTVTETAPVQKSGTKRVVATICLGLFLLFLLTGLLMPAVRTARPAAFRMACSNNLKQIGLALHNYKATYDCFPPAYTVDTEGRPLHSWRTLLLPYLEQQALYERIDLSKPWNDPVNQEAFNSTLSVFSCPAADRETDNTTTYLAMLGEHQCIQVGGSSQEQSDAALKRNGVCVVEVIESKKVPWMQPTDADLIMMSTLVSSEQQPHPNGMTALRADATVQFVGSSISLSTFKELVTGNHRPDAPAEKNVTLLNDE